MHSPFRRSPPPGSALLQCSVRAASLSSRHREHAGGAAGGALVLRRADDDRRARRAALCRDSRSARRRTCRRRAAPGARRTSALRPCRGSGYRRPRRRCRAPARESAPTSSLNPGACIVPLASLFRNRAASPMRASQPECIATNAPRGSRPCCFSHASTSSTVSIASASFAARDAMEIDRERREEAIGRQAIGGRPVRDKMRRRVHVRAGVLVERNLVGEEPVLRNRELRANLHRLEGGKHRQLRREGVRQIEDVAEALFEPDRLLLRGGQFRSRRPTAASEPPSAVRNERRDKSWRTASTIVGAHMTGTLNTYRDAARQFKAKASTADASTAGPAIMVNACGSRITFGRSVRRRRWRRRSTRSGTRASRSPRDVSVREPFDPTRQRRSA